MALGFEGLGKRRTVIGVFKNYDGFHIKEEGSGTRWEVAHDYVHRKLLGKRVRATGWEIGERRMIAIKMTLAD